MEWTFRPDLPIYSQLVELRQSRSYHEAPNAFASVIRRDVEVSLNERAFRILRVIVESFDYRRELFACRVPAGEKTVAVGTLD